MYAKIAAVVALAAAPLVSAHGKVTVFSGDAGGNSTALGIKGASVAVYGQNYQTEPDTTTFWSKDINTDDDFGYTDTHGDNTLSDFAQTIALSGKSLAQVTDVAMSAAPGRPSPRMVLARCRPLSILRPRASSPRLSMPTS